MALRQSKRRNSELPVIRLTGESQNAKKPFARMAAHYSSLPDRELSLMFTTQELASHLRVTTRTIRRWVLCGILPEPLQIGNRSPRWLRSVIDGWFHQHQLSKRQAALSRVPTVIERNEA
jgi:predicted DNA-binding transcriptional regulator AlpA